MIKKIGYCILFLLTINSCAQQGEDSIRLIPEGYQGVVLIIFNQEDGEPKEYQDGKRIYRIPENGILKSQFEPNYGIQKHQYFYVNSEGEKTEIPFVLVNNKEVIKEITPNNIYAYFEKAMGKSFGIDAQGKEYIIEPARTFYVGSLKDIDKEHRELLGFTFKHHKK